MAKRRPFGRLYRKRLNKRDKVRSPGQTFYPGWYLRVRMNGKEITRYAGRDRDTAVEYLKKLEREADRLVALGEKPENTRTFAEFATEYLAWAKKTMSHDTYNSRRTIVENVMVPALGESRLQDIRRPDVDRFLMSDSDWKPATRNRYLSAISAMFKRAIELGHVTENPAVGMKRQRETVTPLPVIPAADQEKIVNAMPDHLRPLVVVALDTGARQGELLRISVGDVDLRSGSIQVRTSKNRRPRLLRMTARLRALLPSLVSARDGADDPRLFPDLIGEDGRLKSWAYREYQIACASAGYPDLRFHDLRHLTAINLVRAGLDLVSIKNTLGHSSLQSTMRYAEHADDTAASRAAALLDRLHARH